ncbi:MAG: hypothetical protein ACR2IF_12865 [Terriglobales bacterium]
MKFALRLFALLLVAGATLLCAADKKIAVSAKTIDSGSFGVFIDGKRVATETFRIEQSGDNSITRSEFKVEDATKAYQTSEMTLAANGDLRRYSWNELSPSKAQAVIEPQDQFLVEHLTLTGAEKPVDQPYILPPSTVILDDYFFSQRELLAWRYLGSSCQQRAGQTECKLSKAQYGALIPRQRTSVLVNLEFIGSETVSVHGQPRRLTRFNLQAEGSDWALWLDDEHKLVRIYIAADRTEVVRD